MSTYKMKGLFKGLRYISQIFESEKEPEMEIGTPTDVKHVAHIGWDGGSANQNSPSWMNDFNASGGYSSSSPLGNIKEDGSCISEDSTRSRDIPRHPKSSRDRSNNLESPAKERSRRSSNSSGNPKPSRRSKESSNISQDGFVRSRRKKSKDKDSVNGGSTRSSRRAREPQAESINGSMSDADSLISLSFEDL